MGFILGIVIGVAAYALYAHFKPDNRLAEKIDDLVD